jgi:AraC-like DNA-binding protein
MTLPNLTAEPSWSRAVGIPKFPSCELKYEGVSGREIDRQLVYYDHINLGLADVFQFNNYGPTRITRTLNEIRSDHGDDFIYGLPINAPISVSQSGCNETILPGNFSFITTSKPFNAICEEPCSEFVVRIPGSVLRLLIPNVDTCFGPRLRVPAGVAQIIRSSFETTFREGRSLSKVQANRFGKLLIDLVAYATNEAMELADPRMSPKESSYKRVVERAKAYIECNLSDPMLDIRMISKHCNVSMRYLQLAFNAFSLNVGSFVRDERMKACKAALRDPRMKDRKVIDIAMRWGFLSPSSFSTSYRKRFGVSPKSERMG